MSWTSFAVTDRSCGGGPPPLHKEIFAKLYHTMRAILFDTKSKVDVKHFSFNATNSPVFPDSFL